MTTRTLLTGTVMLLALSGATVAHAQAVPRRYPTPAPTAPSWNHQSAYDDGYRMGAIDGEHDGRDGRGYRGNARDAWRARGSRYGGDMRRAFEDGYERGYWDAYARFDRRSSRDRGRDSWGYGGYGGYGRYGSPALDNGYRDGYDEGLDAGRDRDRFDPVREKDYRKADRGYNGRYGSKERYQAEYRDGFRRGYEEGYRDATQYGRGRDSRGPWGSRWPFVF